MQQHGLSEIRWNFFWNMRIRPRKHSEYGRKKTSKSALKFLPEAATYRAFRTAKRPNCFCSLSSSLRYLYNTDRDDSATTSLCFAFGFNRNYCWHHVHLVARFNGICVQISGRHTPKDKHRLYSWRPGAFPETISIPKLDTRTER